MRRFFLSQLLASIASSLALGITSHKRKTNQPLDKDVTPTRFTNRDVAGLWYLVDVSADENHIPHHRVDISFKVEGNQLSGAVVSRVTREEIPLRELKFDGQILSFKMESPKGNDLPLELPTLVMKAVSERFEGYWMKSGTEKVGAMLKLVKAK